MTDCGARAATPHRAPCAARQRGMAARAAGEHAPARRVARPDRPRPRARRRRGTHRGRHVAASRPHPRRASLRCARSSRWPASTATRRSSDAAGRARRLSGLELPFAEVRAVKHALGGTMIDVILTIMARAMGAWHRAHRLDVEELLTLVPVNLRTPEEWAEKAHVGNVATGILVPLPIGWPIRSPPTARCASAWKRKRRSGHRAPRPCSRKRSAYCRASCSPGSPSRPSATSTSSSPTSPASWCRAISPAPRSSPPTRSRRWRVRSPVSVALYGYRDHLFIGLNSDEARCPTPDRFQRMIRAAFDELQWRPACDRARLRHGAAPSARRERAARLTAGGHFPRRGKPR